MTIFVYNFLEDDSGQSTSAVGIELSGDGDTESSLDWDQDHEDESIFGQMGHESEARVTAFFGALSARAGGIRPGDLRIADSLEWQMEVGGLLD